MEICLHCGKEGKSVKFHIWRMHGEGRYHNPNSNRVAWNKGKTKETDDRLVAAGKVLSKTLQNKPKTGCCSKEYLDSPAHKINSAKGGGYRENAGHSKKFKVFDSFGKQTTLQSSYELECSKLLDKMNIKWNRPKAIKYSGRNYFPDFYLPEYDVYLDPKNNYKAKLDSEKIALVIKENNIKLFVLLKEQINEEYIGLVIQR